MMQQSHRPLLRSAFSSGTLLGFFDRLVIIDYRLVSFDYDCRVVAKIFDRVSIKIDFWEHLGGAFFEVSKH